MEDEVEVIGGEESPSTATESQESREFIRTEPLGEVRARLYAEREEKRSGLASQGVEDDAEGEANPKVAPNDQPDANEAQSTATESEEPEADESTLPVEEQLRRERQRFQTLSANTKRLSEEARQLRQQFEATQRASQEAAARQATEAEYAAGQEEVRRIESYIETLPEHQREDARSFYRARILAREAENYNNFVQQRAQTIEERERDIQLRETRTALPEYVGKMIDQIGEVDKTPTEFMKEVTADPRFRNLLANYEEPRDLTLIGEVLRAVGFVEAARSSQRRQGNRTDAVRNNVHVTPRGAGSGNVQTFREALAAVPSSEWEAFKAQAKRRGLSNALDSRG